MKTLKQHSRTLRVFLLLFGFLATELGLQFLLEMPKHLENLTSLAQWVPKFPVTSHLHCNYGGIFSTPLAAQTNDKNNFEPLPYGEDEFPIFWQDLRRFEVVLIGSIPVTLLLGSLVYDIIYSINDPDIHDLVSASRESDILAKIGISISISGLLAVIDMAIHLSKRHKQRRERERVLRDSEFIGGANQGEPGESSSKAATTAPRRADAKPGKTRAPAPQGN